MILPKSALMILWFKFPHTLTVKQREFIHKKAEALSLSTKSEGTRYRVVY